MSGRGEASRVWGAWGAGGLSYTEKPSLRGTLYRDLREPGATGNMCVKMWHVPAWRRLGCSGQDDLTRDVCHLLGSREAPSGKWPVQRPRLGNTLGGLEANRAGAEGARDSGERWGDRQAGISGLWGRCVLGALLLSAPRGQHGPQGAQGLAQAASCLRPWTVPEP